MECELLFSVKTRRSFVRRDLQLAPRPQPGTQQKLRWPRRLEHLSPLLPDLTCYAAVDIFSALPS
ncbi:hypothetical protein L208DRAFT_1411955 [Tricholoma matsutake]|nr:hypothetical protein L208DRAFT_1411955 [Tricholoma matsutake 945]